MHRRRLDAHPSWCGQGHVCAAERGGDHRSYPETTDTALARIVLTRIRTGGGQDRIETRVVADLPPDPAEAEAATRAIVADIYRALSG